MKKCATGPEGNGRRSRISAARAITRVIGGTGFVAFSRKLDEPWQSVLSFALLVLSCLWPVFLAGVSAWFARWRLTRDLADLKKAAEALPAGPKRSRIERNIQEIREAIVEKELRALKKLAGEEAEPEAAAGRRRSQRRALPTRSGALDGAHVLEADLGLAEREPRLVADRGGGGRRRR